VFFGVAASKHTTMQRPLYPENFRFLSSGDRHLRGRRTGLITRIVD
jgi:hypothetical protein